MVVNQQVKNSLDLHYHKKNNMRERSIAIQQVANFFAAKAGNTWSGMQKQVRVVKDFNGEVIEENHNVEHKIQQQVQDMSLILRIRKTHLDNNRV